MLTQVQGFSDFVLEQWRAIDRDYKDPNAPQSHARWVLVTAAVALVIPKYFGSPSSFHQFPWLGALFADVPHPSLHPHLFWAAFKLVHYGLLPYVCIKLVLKKNVRDFGAHFVWEPKIWLLYLGMLCVILPLTYLASGTQSFLKTYPKYGGAGESLEQFFLWEAAYAFQFLMLEFFFRGFLSFALARHFGSLAVFVMAVPYAMIHLSKPLAECLGAIIAGIVLGTVALRTRSILGGVVVHSIVAWTMDIAALAEKGELGRLFSG